MRDTLLHELYEIFIITVAIRIIRVILPFAESLKRGIFNIVNRNNVRRDDELKANFLTTADCVHDGKTDSTSSTL